MRNVNFENQQDVCAYLFEICRRCQHELLDPNAITCLFDVDNSPLPTARCNILGRIVQHLVEDICRQIPAHSSGGRITISLQRVGSVWLLSVADHRIRTFDPHTQVGISPEVEMLAEALEGACHFRSGPQGAVAAVRFVERGNTSDASEITEIADADSMYAALPAPPVLIDYPKLPDGTLH